MHVSGLFIYPLKSGRGIGLDQVRFDPFGPAGDRRLLLVTPDGEAVTQRELPRLAQMDVLPTGGGHRISMEGRGSLMVPPAPPAPRMEVRVWGTGISASLFDEDIQATLSAWLEQPVRLVAFDAGSARSASRDWTQEETPVTFADGFPVLVTTTGSLDALNADMASHGEGQAGMDRFRPNIVVDCDEPWAEDKWSAIEIAGLRFDLVKPCSRCIMTTQDQITGSRDVPSPMPAMGRLRMSADRRVPGPLFGWNAAPRGQALLRLGDTVSVLEHRPQRWALKRP